MNKDWQIPSYEVTEIKPKMAKYCVCIPVINEGERILGQLERIKPFLDRVDVLLLDGGSTDGSTDIESLKHVGYEHC